MEKRNCELVLSVATWEYEKILMCQIKRLKYMRISNAQACMLQLSAVYVLFSA
jgi:hypothetical protein